MPPRGLDHVLALRRLPRPVAVFYLRAFVLALVLRDRVALRYVTRPVELATLLDRSRGYRTVVELGTGPAWTSTALALADEERRIVTFDPKVLTHRSRYVGLVDAKVRSRIEFHRARGEDEPPNGLSIDFVFIDSSHQREPTIATFRMWEPLLRPGGIVAFHDYGNPRWPGVKEAIDALGLQGEELRSFFFWRKPS